MKRQEEERRRKEREAEAARKRKEEEARKREAEAKRVAEQAARDRELANAIPEVNKGNNNGTAMQANYNYNPGNDRKPKHASWAGKRDTCVKGSYDFWAKKSPQER